MPKLIPLLLAILLASAPQIYTRPESLPTPAEFPSQDMVLWMMVSDDAARELAAKRLVEAPGSIETLRLLAAAKNTDGILAVLRTIVDSQPSRIVEAFKAVEQSLWEFRGNSAQTLSRAETLRRIVADARARLSELPREEAAQAERMFMMVDAQFSNDRNSWATGLARFIEQYRGTEAALLAEVDLISYAGVSQQMLDALDAFARARPGTTAAAKAIYQTGFQWHTINTLGTLEPRGADPTPRFIRVLDIVKELEGGRYPKSEWTDRAPALISGFFFPQNVKVAPENVDRLASLIEDFAATHFDLRADFPGDSPIGYLLTSKLADLYEQKGERVPGVEATLARLEKRVSDPASVRFLRGLFYMRPPRNEVPEQRSARLEMARAAFRGVSAEGGALVHRQALATLASLDFAEAQYEEARTSFRKYIASYPGSNWTWVATLRTGQCEEALGNPAAAAAAYLEAARHDSSPTMARVLGYEYAARAFETAGDFARALKEHQQALDSWTGTSLRYTTYWRRSRAADPFVPTSNADEVTKESLVPRIAQLKRSLALPGGMMLERGRTLLALGRHEEAATELQRLVVEFDKSPAAKEGRELGHRARLERALQKAAADRPVEDQAVALTELEALAGEPLDFAVTAAKIARASLLARRGDLEPAESSLRDALKEWQAAQRTTKPSAGLEEDVAEIRRVVFLPQGGGVYGTERWNAFSWPATPSAFMVVNSDVRIKLHDGGVTRASLVQNFPATQNAVFFDTEQLAVLKKMITTLGGTKRREPRQIMETPNQPIGDSMQILAVWNKLFPSRPGHWGGWELETYPVITEIEFTDAKRTRASVRVVIGYAGATVELEKEGGKWIAKRLTNQWVT